MIYFVKTSNDIFILGKQHESAIGLELCEHRGRPRG